MLFDYVIKKSYGALKVPFWHFWHAITFETCICESDFDLGGLRYQLIETNRMVYSLPQKSIRAQSEAHPKKLLKKRD